MLGCAIKSTRADDQQPASDLATFDKNSGINNLIVKIFSLHISLVDKFQIQIQICIQHNYSQHNVQLGNVGYDYYSLLWTRLGKIQSNFLIQRCLLTKAPVLLAGYAKLQYKTGLVAQSNLMAALNA